MEIVAIGEIRAIVDMDQTTKQQKREVQYFRNGLDTLAFGNGEFAESDVWLFSSGSLALVNALVEARIEGV